MGDMNVDSADLVSHVDMLLSHVDDMNVDSADLVSHVDMLLSHVGDMNVDSASSLPCQHVALTCRWHECWQYN